VNEREIKLTWVLVQGSWPNFPIPEAAEMRGIKLAAWLDVLGDVDPDLVRAALASMSSREFPPTPGQIRDEAFRLRNAGDGIAPPPDADAAWLEFKQRYKTRGPWSHPSVAAAASALGCKEFGESPSADEMAWRAHFIKFYGTSDVRFTREGVPLAPAVANLLGGGILKRVPELES
jgi:hypothetical protein